LVQVVLKGARVYQGGGNEIASDNGAVEDLKAAVQEAAQTSLARLYPQFGIARGALSKLKLAAERARQGNGSALDALDYQEEPEKHPVCAQLLDYVGTSGKKGSDIRRCFVGVPFGWPQDAVDAATLVLVASNHLQAAHNGVPIQAKGIDQGKLGQVEFRAVTTTITLPQRIAIRGLLQEIGVQFKQNEESASIPALLEKMLQTAAAAGGEAPLPAHPPTDHLQELKAVIGNEQLAAIHDHRDRLSREFKEWREFA
jgi:hypothetical protein